MAQRVRYTGSSAAVLFAGEAMATTTPQRERKVTGAQKQSGDAAPLFFSMQFGSLFCFQIYCISEGQFVNGCILHAVR